MTVEYTMPTFCLVNLTQVFLELYKTTFSFPKMSIERAVQIKTAITLREHMFVLLEVGVGFSEYSFFVKSCVCRIITINVLQIG